MISGKSEGYGETYEKEESKDIPLKSPELCSITQV